MDNGGSFLAGAPLLKFLFFALSFVTVIIFLTFFSLFIRYMHRKTGVFRTKFNHNFFDFHYEREEFMKENKFYYFLGLSINYLRIFMPVTIFYIVIYDFFFS